MVTTRDIDREVALARHGLTPSAALRDRVRNGLVASGAATRGASALLVAEMMRSQSPWEALRSSGRVGLTLGAALVALGVGSGYWLRPAADEPPPLPRAPVVASTEDPALEPEMLPPLPLEPEALDTVPSAERQRAPAADPKLAPYVRPQRARRTGIREASPPAPAANDEMSLLQRAERAVRADNPALALALTSELDDRYPRSQLLQERSAIVLLARCESSDHDMTADAKQFLREYPKSVYASRIRELCLNSSAANQPASNERLEH